MNQAAPLRWKRCAACLAALLLGGGAASSQSPCGELKNHFGPFDYRVERGERLRLVESYHFTPGIEALVRPVNTTHREMAADVAYTLHVFPNHHRALITMVRLGERHRTELPPGAKFTIECYFDRAVRFADNDVVVRLLLARYLASKNRKEDAVRQLAFASEMAGKNALSHFNIGLAYFELKEFERARVEALKAHELGLQRKELIEMLRQEQQWPGPGGRP